MRLSNDLPSRTCRLLLCVLMVMAWCGRPRAAAAQSTAGPVKREAPTAPQIADSLEAAAKGYAALARDLPRDRFDVKAAAALAGRDPAKVLAWVRENTRFVPYRGVLRGPAGVLMDRRGNSLDRALLLAALLGEAGKRVRLARATLPPERADELVRSAWEGPAPAAEGTSADAAVDPSGAKYGLDPARVQAAAKERELARQKLREEIVGTVTDQAKRLQALLRAAGGGAVTAPDGDAEQSRLREAAADHFWVQYQDGGTWVDLDPAADPAGATPAPRPSDTFALSRGAAVPAALDKSLVHEVELRVRVEQLKGGALAEKVALTHVLRPAELGHRPVTLHVLPLGARPPIEPAKGALGDQIREALAGQTRWAPVLSVGQGAFLEKGFDAAGDLVDAPGEAMGDSGRTARSKAGGAGGLLGGLPGGEPAPMGNPQNEPAPPRPLGDGELTAAWIEFEIRSPGREARVVRREIVDVIGPAARAAGQLPSGKLDEAARLARAAALARQVDVLAVGCVLPRALVLHTHLEKFAREAPPLARAMRQADRSPAGTASAAEAVARVRATPGPLLSLASARGEAAALAGGAGAFAVDRINVLALHKSVVVRPDGALASRHTIDIVANEVLTSPGGEGFATRLRQGVLETHLEALAMGPGRSGANTAALFAAAPAQGVEWVALRGADDGALARLKLDDDSRARIAADLRAGYAVVAPVAPVKVGGAARAAWWRVGLRDGGCVGVGQGGMGSEAAERTTLHDVMLMISALRYGYELYSCFAENQGVVALGCAVCTTLFLFVTEGSGSIFDTAVDSIVYTVAMLPADKGIGMFCNPGSE